MIARPPAAASTVVLVLGLALIAAACGSSEDSSDAGYAERMAREHAGDTPVPAGAASGKPAVGVRDETVAYATIDGRPVEGFLALPQDAAAGSPGIVVIHEWWGLNDNIREMARKLAAQGYVALAVDLYGGKSAEDADGARALVQAVMEHPERAEANLRAAVDYLANGREAGKIGVIGWCFGGGWSLQTALMMPGRISAAVIYYGRLVTDLDELRPIASMPILGIFGAEDQGIPVSDARAFEHALEDSLGDRNVEIEVYAGAGHAFANPSGTRYVPEAAADAWGKTTAFLAKWLK